MDRNHIPNHLFTEYIALSVYGRLQWKWARKRQFDGRKDVIKLYTSRTQFDYIEIFFLRISLQEND